MSKERSSKDAAAGGAAPRFICFLCKRKFQSAVQLTRHKQLSELHKVNLQKQDEEIQHKKDELRKAVGHVRKQIHDLEHVIVKNPTAEGQSHRQSLEMKLRQTLGEYGQIQEKLEASRHQQALERSGAPSTAGPGAIAKMTEGRETQVGQLIVSVGSATWQGNKEVQEDRYMIDMHFETSDGQKVVGFCVLDGHSGSLCADALVESLPRNLGKAISKVELSDDALSHILTEEVVKTDEEFLCKAREREVLDGSTGLICLIYPSEGRKGGQRMMLANIGDSRAVLCRSQNGKLHAVRLTDDHKPGRADEQRRIEQNGGVVDHKGVWRVFTPGPASFGGRNILWGLAVSRAFGDLLMKEPQRYGCAGAIGELVTAVPEIHTYDLKPESDRFLILACDGIWDVLTDEAAVSVCTEHQTADLAAHALIRRAFEVGSDDNLTALVVAWQQADSEAPKEDGGDRQRQRID